MEIKEILGKSYRAIGGSFEKEVVVDANEVFNTMRDLKNAGFAVVGTGPAGFGGKKKILFNPSGINI